MTTPTKGSRRFDRWAEEKGGGRAAAELLGTHEAHVSHLRSGGRTPSLQLAVKIQLATRGSKVGEIHPCEWVRIGTRKASSTSPAPAEEAAA